jgi:hypothetical protein
VSKSETPGRRGSHQTRSSTASRTLTPRKGFAGRETPDIVAGDVIEAVDADGNGHFFVVQNVEVTQPATLVDTDADADACAVPTV